ncbi:riboflavin biosynthesis pyrimidine reductase [Microbacterium endophyticum]|uniref:Riboflavin biosynthesis pyrimidine reductase n=1 Tax=Microbacterium endophyticum TaxID=1526412 RepID=A0A7W4YNW6_9MICO|nr:dihydrofolate reductase family protein [Microbacterium endophyticum]MBB2976989.1 riboflavin biosynthesis pyrimidine reductase [Microbacterium endophyticum]NIK36725.1 riboflavin biosynthesis pyrimidine reductase [Microbacterium endophyticum]
MRLTQIATEYSTSVDVDLDASECRDLITRQYARTDATYVRLNMITSLTGSAAGTDGTSDTLTNPVDRMILGVVRSDADVVVVGAQSVRAEGYIVPRTARLAVVTSSGNLTGHQLRLDDEESIRQVLIVCAKERAEEVRRQLGSHPVEIVALASGADGRIAPQDIIDALAERALHRVVCEGGPSLASQFVQAGVIDEYCVTVAPLLEPANAPFLTIERAFRPRTEVAGHLADSAGFNYLRLRVVV